MKQMLDLYSDYLLASLTNHFALKTKLYVNALQSAFQTLREMNPIHLSA